MSKDVTFSTTDELFSALRLPEIRQVLLQACQDSDVRSEALKALLQDRYADLLSTADEASGMLTSVRSLVDKVEELRSASKELISLAEKNERSHQQSNSTTTANVATLEGGDALGDNNKVVNTTEESSLALYGSSNAARGQEGPLRKKFEIERRIEAWLFSSFASIESFRMQQDHLTASLSVANIAVCGTAKALTYKSILVPPVINSGFTELDAIKDSVAPFHLYSSR